MGWAQRSSKPWPSASVGSWMSLCAAPARGGLNDGCGADYVQKERRFPAGIEDCQNGARSAAALQKTCGMGLHAMQSQAAVRLPSRALHAPFCESLT